MLRNDLNDLDTNGHKGDWCFLNDDLFIALRYGEDPFKGLVILPLRQTEKTPNHWNWNENREAPTLTPSILVNKYEGWTDGWHGFLTDGKLVEA